MTNTTSPLPIGTLVRRVKDNGKRYQIVAAPHVAGDGRTYVLAAIKGTGRTTNLDVERIVEVDA